MLDAAECHHIHNVLVLSRSEPKASKHVSSKEISRVDFHPAFLCFRKNTNENTYRTKQIYVGWEVKIENDSAD